MSAISDAHIAGRRQEASTHSDDSVTDNAMRAVVCSGLTSIGFGMALPVLSSIDMQLCISSHQHLRWIAQSSNVTSSICRSSLLLNSRV